MAAIGCIHFYRQNARKFLLYSINQAEETINKNNYVLLILSLTENSYRYFSSVFHFFSFFSPPFDLIDYHILLREFDNCSTIIQLSDFLPFSIPSTVLPNDQSEFVLFPFQPSTPFILPLKGMCLFIVPLFLAAPTVNQSLSLFLFSPRNFPPSISFLTSPTSIELNGNMKLYYIRYYANYRGRSLIPPFTSSQFIVQRKCFKPASD